MSKSVIACAIEADECSVARLKATGKRSYALGGCRTFRFGLRRISEPGGERLLQRLVREAGSWKEGEVALCIGQEGYRPLPARFPREADGGERDEYCRMEAAAFLAEPDRYDWDLLRQDDGGESGPYEERLLLFYGAAPIRLAGEAFRPAYELLFSGSPIPPFVNLSALAEQPQALLELSDSHLLLAVASEGRLVEFTYHPVKNRDELAYFAIRALSGSRHLEGMPVQVSGPAADRRMAGMVSAQTGVRLSAPAIPSCITIRGLAARHQRRPSAIKALSAALLALGG